MDSREERLAKNEIIFRDVNERIRDAADVGGVVDPHELGFLCECSNVDCTLRLRVSLADYERARREASQFIVAPGHELPEIEHVVFVGDGFQVVSKEGDAAALAEERDPRS